MFNTKRKNSVDQLEAELVRARERRDRLREQLGEAQGPCDFTPPVGWSGGLSRPHYAGAELTRTLAAETLALMRRMAGVPA